MNVHRYAVTISGIENLVLNRDAEMQIVSYFMFGCESVVHKGQMKPYVWYFEKAGSSKYLLVFSSIDMKIADFFAKKAKELENSMILVGDYEKKSIVIEKCFPINDVNFFSDTMTFRMITGITFKRLGAPYWVNPEKWHLRIARTLVMRSNAFLGTSYSEDDVKIKCLSYEIGNVKYKKYLFKTTKLVLKINAPKEIMMTALYGGIGNHTGSGFGAANFI